MGFIFHSFGEKVLTKAFWLMLVVLWFSLMGIVFFGVCVNCEKALWLLLKLVANASCFCSLFSMGFMFRGIHGCGERILWLLKRLAGLKLVVLWFFSTGFMFCGIRGYGEQVSWLLKRLVANASCFVALSNEFRFAIKCQSRISCSCNCSCKMFWGFICWTRKLKRKKQ